MRLLLTWGYVAGVEHCGAAVAGGELWGLGGIRSQRVGVRVAVSRHAGRQVVVGWMFGQGLECVSQRGQRAPVDRKSTRLNSSHPSISYAVFCLKKKKYIHT